MKKIDANFETVENLALVIVFGGSVRLCCDWSVDWECDNGIKRNEYGPQWAWEKDNPRIENYFYDLVDEVNGATCGGIGIDDGETYEAVQSLIDRTPCIVPSDIAGAEDGTYIVVFNQI